MPPALGGTSDVADEGGDDDASAARGAARDGGERGASLARTAADGG